MPDFFAPAASDLQKIGVSAFPTPGQGLALDQSGKIPRNVGAVLILDKNTGTVDVQTTIVETTLYSYTFAAGILGTTGSTRLTLHGDYLHNNVAGNTLTFRVKFGGTTHMDFDFGGAFGGVLGAVRQTWKTVIEISNVGAVNAQTMNTVGWAVRANQAAPAAGVGGIYDSINTGGTVGSAGANGTIDTTVDVALLVTAQWSASSANNSFKKKYAVLELF